MALQTSKIRFQQPKYSLGIQRGCACCRSTDNETLLPLQQTSRFSDVRFNTRKVGVEFHYKPPERLKCSGATAA